MKPTAVKPRLLSCKSASLITLLLFLIMTGPACSNPTAQAAADGSKVASANNRFGLDLYQRTKATKENLFFSPFSISSALAMTYAGARGQTAKEMAQTLHFELPQNELHPAFA